MKILLIEDVPLKKDAIKKEIINILGDDFNEQILTYAEDLTIAIRELYTNQFDLIIFDMFLPDVYGSGHEKDCSQELIEAFSKSKNYQSESIALTQYELSEIEDIQLFNLAGITLVNFNESRNWSTALKLKIEKISQKISCDFLIFCALSKERLAFHHTECDVGDSKNIFGMDCLYVKVDNFNGFIIKPHTMGLVNMAIVAAKAIEYFQPKIVAMSGICAGVKDESDYLDIIVGKTCWEYQTGKWKDGEFKQEPYQVDLSRTLQTDLQLSSENKMIIDHVRSGLFNTELGKMNIRVSPLSSGSAVIADEELMKKIGMQHRKMAGLEMEMYALYEAAAQSLSAPLYFGAKAVVDMGDSSKGDLYHETGSIISARYVSLIIKQQLKKLLP